MAWESGGWETRSPSEIQMGNGTLLATFDASGEIEQLFAPNIDALQSRVGSFQTSIIISSQEIIPIKEEFFEISLKLGPGSQILETEYRYKHKPIHLRRRMALHPSEPLLLDHWRIVSDKTADGKMGLLHQSIPWMGHSTSAHCSMYHPTFNGIVHHRGRRWLGMIARAPVRWQRVGHLSDSDRYRLWAGERIPAPIGNEDLRDFPNEEAHSGWDQVVQGCATWGALAVGPAEEFGFLIVCAESERHLGRLIGQVEHLPIRRFFQMIDGMVERRYFPAFPILNRIENSVVKGLCERSIDVLHSLQDIRSGALLAAAEVDPHSRMSGGYGYSWPRDGAYLASALGAFGFRDRVEQYFRFLTDTQDASGAWWQRYLATGHAGPSWGRIQIDEPATVLGAAYMHFRRTQDHLWLENLWPTLFKGLSFLESLHSHEEPMGLPSHDLWEERMGFHAYSLAAVATAFLTGSHLAGELMQSEAQMRFRTLGEKISSLIREKFVSENGALYRSLICGSHGNSEYWDQAVDASLLGLIKPFGVIHKSHPTAYKICQAVRSKLWHQSVGGILRYEGDGYRGGNPWILTTLWLASIDITMGNVEEASKAFQWVISKATPLGMFAEQVHRESGKPFWVIPLGWSHAMFLLFVKEVLDRNLEDQIWGSLPTSGS